MNKGIGAKVELWIGFGIAAIVCLAPIWKAIGQLDVVHLILTGCVTVWLLAVGLIATSPPRSWLFWALPIFGWGVAQHGDGSDRLLWAGLWVVALLAAFIARRLLVSLSWHYTTAKPPQ